MIATALLNSLWQGALIVAIAAIVNALVPAHHAASRYLIWLTALAALVVVPLATAFYPQAAYDAMPVMVVRASAATSAVVTRAADSASFWLLLAWLLGVLFCVSRLSVSGVRIVAMLRASRSASLFGNDVRISDRMPVPIAAGLLRAVVVLPEGMVETLPVADLRSLIEHERGHIARGDILTNYLQRLIEALLFFNPWVYLIGRELVKERENACDDRAVLATGAAETYAASLAAAAIASRQKNLLLTPSALGSRRSLLARVARLLSEKETVVKANYVPAAACAIAFALLTFSLGSKGLAHSQNAASSLPANCYRSAMVIVAAPPDIPKDAFRPNVSAEALVTIDANGHPLKAKIVTPSGSSAIDNATVEAAMHSTYKPKLSDCKAVAGTYLFRVDTGT
jgi:beta-lactamase regulating signal transducer with metallopeptidase domain